MTFKWWTICFICEFNTRHIFATIVIIKKEGRKHNLIARLLVCAYLFAWELYGGLLHCLYFWDNKRESENARIQQTLNSNHKFNMLLFHSLLKSVVFYKQNSKRVLSIFRFNKKESFDQIIYCLLYKVKLLSP